MDFTKNLKQGMRGDDVRAVKERLLALGYLHAATHDRFGADTTSAVRRFQSQAGLEADGVVGQLTWAALFGAAEPAAPIEKATPSEKALAVCALAVTRVGDLYVWGASGQADISDGAIKNRDDEYARAIKFRDKQTNAGITDLLAHDCSGFISWLLRQTGVWDTRRDCDGLWGNCTSICKEELIAGDLLFRVSASNAEDETHVGLYLGGGRVIHCKGRDAGVVLEGVDAGGSGYWKKFGRCKLLYKEA